MNTEERNAVFSIIFYIISAIAVTIFNSLEDFKSGPCTPNLDFLSFFFVLILNIIFLLTSAILAFGLKKATKYSFFIHLFATACIIIYLTTNH